MSDRELLELAAKAAGVRILDWVDAGPRLTDGINERVVIWNPLIDDGDALRLAVRLELDVMTCGRTPEMREEIQVGGKVKATTFQSIAFPFDDPCAATRRAIVRAAAEIGKHSAPSDSGRDDA